MSRHSSRYDEDNDTQFSILADLISFIKSHDNGNPLTADEYDLMISCIDNTTKMVTKKLRPSIVNDGAELTKGAILDWIQQKETCFDLEQRKVAMVSIDSPQRIRGLAGSGKTILLTMKAALYHLSNPEAEILYTYYTKDLY